MAVYSKKILNGSVNGNNILIADTSSPGTLIHTAITGTSDLDEVWIYATTVSGTSDVTLTIQFGGTATKDNVTVTMLAGTGLQLIVPGLLQQNSHEIRAFAGSANTLAVTGFVNRIIE
jgi:hypothetical protein